MSEPKFCVDCKWCNGGRCDKSERSLVDGKPMHSCETMRYRRHDSCDVDGKLWETREGSLPSKA